MSSIPIDFPCERFTSAPRTLLRTAVVFGANLPMIAGITLLVFLPATLMLQYVYSLAEVPANGVLSYILMEAGDLALSALAVPAILHALTFKLRDGKLPPLTVSLRWGRRQWGKMLWNTFRMEVSIMLATLLLIVPGIVTALNLFFVETIVAIEADRTSDVPERSRTLALGHRWRMFFVMLPLSILSLVGSMAVLQLLKGAANSHLLLAVTDSVLAVAAQISTVAALLIYLGLVEPERKKR